MTAPGKLEGTADQGQRRQWPPTPVLSPGKPHGRRSLVGCSPWSLYESDMTERLHFHFSLSCLGKRNGNPLQCSCLENPRDRGAWWAAFYGVAQSWTRLKRLGGSSSRSGPVVHCLSENHWVSHGMNLSDSSRKVWLVTNIFGIFVIRFDSIKIL